MTCVDQIDTAAPESRLACWQHGLDRLAPRVERLREAGTAPWEGDSTVRVTRSSQAAPAWHSPWERDAMSGTSAGPRRQVPRLSPGGWRLSARRQHLCGGPPAPTPRRSSSANPRRAQASSGVRRSSRARCGRERSAPLCTGHPPPQCRWCRFLAVQHLCGVPRDQLGHCAPTD